MTAPSLPDGYNVTKHVRAGRSDRHVTVGFDREGTRIPRFLIQLHYQKRTAPVRWTAIARIDHNDTADDGHDVYQEGLHVDVSRREGETVHLQLRHAPLSPNRGVVIRRSAEYLIRESEYFVDVYEGQITPIDPPRWPDGGDTAPTFIPSERVEGGMSQESPAEDALTLEELSEELANATGTTIEEIERGAEELEIAPPSEATVVDE
ncbi:hypothetical protein [Halorubrum sp. F4]|uniref:DUF7718 family protein n=1 Tax=Halorubrum sp. F4 TaxID=2989715 RepID=UPI002480AA2C|nr:hypothetical protein [Halorubrum sp. F4]